MIKRNILHPNFEKSGLTLVIDTSEDCTRLADGVTLFHCPSGGYQLAFVGLFNDFPFGKALWAVECDLAANPSIIVKPHNFKPMGYRGRGVLQVTRRMDVKR